MEQRPPWYPSGEFDAMKWADEFDRIFPGRMDKGTMLGWFANAIMTGYDTARRSPSAASSQEKTESGSTAPEDGERPADHPADTARRGSVAGAADTAAGMDGGVLRGGQR